MNHFIRLAFAATELSLTSESQAIAGLLQGVSVRVDLHTGAIVPVQTLLQRPRLPALSLTLGQATAKLEETAEGPFTVISDPELGATRFAGEARNGVREGELVLCLASMPGPRVDCLVMCLRTHSVVRQPALSASRFASGPNLVACTGQQILHVARLHEGQLESLTVALPESVRIPEVAITGTRIVVLSGTHLVVLDANSLSFAQAHTSLPLTLTQREARGESLEGAAKVVFVLSDKVLVDHPVRKRLTLPLTSTSPQVAKGDEVVIDDLREELRGDPRVHAWHKVGQSGGDAEKGMPEPATLTLEARILPPLDASSKTLKNRILLEKMATKHGFRVPSKLLHLLMMHDEDAVMRRLLGKLGMDCIEVRDLVRDWDADPCLIAFSGRGTGDETCLYIYPPYSFQHEPPIVEFNHEENLVEPLALTFDHWITSELNARVEREPDLAPIADRVRQALRLPSTDVPHAEVTWPAWFDAPRNINGFKSAKEAEAKGRALMDEGKWMEAERYLLRAYLEPDGAKATRALLTRVYIELGWSLPRDHLASRDA